MKIFVISRGRFATLNKEEKQSGFWMAYIQYEDRETDWIYSDDYINAEKEYNNAEIWDMFERYNIGEEIKIVEKNKKKSAVFYDFKKFRGADFEIGDRWVLDRVID